MAYFKDLTLICCFCVTLISPGIAVGDDVATTSATGKPNEFIERLKASKTAMEKVQETARKSSAKNGIPYKPDLSSIRLYEYEIMRAQKIVADGGVYGEAEYQAFAATLLVEAQNNYERAIQNSKDTLSTAMRENNDKFNRVMAGVKKTHQEAISKSEETYRTKIAPLDLAKKFRANAGKIGIMIWNLPIDPALHDRSSVLVNLDLMSGDRNVLSRKGLRLSRTTNKNPLRLPNVMFDKVRIEVTRWRGVGGGLAEVQVFLGEENVALGRPCDVSSIETLPIHLDDRNALTDGIVAPVTVGEGYWVPEENSKSWVTIDLLGKPDQSVLDAASSDPR